MPTYHAGDADITVHPNFDDFVGELRAKLEAEDPTLDISVKANVEEAVAEVEAFTEEDHTVDLDVFLQGIEEATAELDELAHERTAEVKVNVNGAAKQSIDDLGQKIQNLGKRIGLNITLPESASKALDDLKQKMSGLSLPKSFASALDGLSLKFKGFKSNLDDWILHPILSVRAAFSNFAEDVAGKLNKGLDKVGSKIKDFGSKVLNGIKHPLSSLTSIFSGVNKGITGIFGNLGKLGGQIGGVVAQMGPLVAAIAILGPGLLGIGSALAVVAGPAIGAIALGLDGIKQAAQTAAPAFTALKNSVSSTFQTDLVPGFQQLSQLMEKITPSMQGIAGALSDVFNSVATTLNNSGIDTVLKSIPQFLEAAKPGIDALVQGFVNFGNAFAPVMAQLGGGFGQLMSSLGDALTTLGPPLAQIATQAFPLFANILKALAPALAPLLTGLSQIAGILGQALITALQAVTPVLPTIANAFVQILKAISPLVAPLTQLVAALLGPLASLFAQLAQALAPVIQDLANGLTPVIQQLAPILTQVANIIGQAFLQAIQQLEPYLPQIFDSLGKLLIALLPLIPPLIQLALSLMPIWTKALSEILPYLPKIIDFITKWAGVIVQQLVPQIEALATKISNGWNTVIKPTWDAMKKAFDAFYKDFKQLIDQLIADWKKFTDTISAPFKFAGNALSGVENFGKSLFGGGTHATGGLISGPGTGTSDSIPAFLSNGEFVMNAEATKKHMPLLMQMNARKFADGGPVTNTPFTTTPLQQQQQSDQETQDQIAIQQAKDKQAKTDKDPKATVADRQAAAQAVQDATVKAQKDKATGVKVPGEKNPNGTTLYPQAALPGAQSDNQIQIENANSAVDKANSDRNKVYADPTSTAEDKAASDRAYIQAQNSRRSDLQQQQKDATKDFSVQGIFSKLGTALANGILGGLGLQDSIFSDSNSYNSAITQGLQSYNGRKQKDSTAPYDYNPKNLAESSPSGTDTSGLSAGDLSGGASGTSNAGSTAGSGAGASNTGTGTGTSTGSNYSYNQGGGVQQWSSLFSKVLADLHMPQSWLSLGLSQMQTESSGNPKAINLWDSNAKKGTPSKGLMQVIDPTFATQFPKISILGYKNDIWDPGSNIAAALEYTVANYGSPVGVWGNGHGYASGGLVSGQGGPRQDLIKALLSNGEYVVNSASTSKNRAVLDAINSGAQMQPIRSAGGSASLDGGNVHHDHSLNIQNVSTLNSNQFIRDLDRFESQRAMGYLVSH